MSALAQKSGLGRESLYKALKPGTQPRYDTIMKLIGALGVKVVFRVSHDAEVAEQSGIKAAVQKTKRRGTRALAGSKSRIVGRSTELRGAAKSEARLTKKRSQK